MGDPSMALGAEDVKRIAELVKPWLRDTVLEMIPPRSTEIDTQLLERMVRVEEELKAQRELMAVRFDAVDRRFEDVLALMDRRFEAADKRFEDLQTSLDKRFDGARVSADKRFEDLQTSLDKRFDDAQAHSDKRFAALQWTMLVGLAVVTGAVTFFAMFV